MGHKAVRLTCVLMTVALLSLFTVTPAWAAGWWRENANDTINNVANNGSHTTNPLWSTAVGNTKPAGYTYNNPHGNFSTTSNRCKTCHAVHGALSTSFRLLKDVTRTEECNYCHMGPAGASQLRLYALDDVGFAVKGEHTLGSTAIPDSNINGGATGVGNLPDRGGPYDTDGKQALYCYSCHSVHGSRVIQNADISGGWDEKILRVDPGGNGGSADNGLQAGVNGEYLTREDGATVDVMDEEIDSSFIRRDSRASGAQVRAAFCSDCHNKNYNFRANMSESEAGTVIWGTTQEAGKDYSLTRQSHPMNDNQWLDVGGGAGTTGYIQVSATGFDVEWCGACHTASSEREYGVQAAGTNGDPWNSAWRVVGFPHQSKGNKFFQQSYTAGSRDATQTNDAYEAIEAMDENVCLQCHRNMVGVTF